MRVQLVSRESCSSTVVFNAASTTVEYPLQLFNQRSTVYTQTTPRTSGKAMVGGESKFFGRIKFFLKKI